MNLKLLNCANFCQLVKLFFLTHLYFCLFCSDQAIQNCSTLVKLDQTKPKYIEQSSHEIKVKPNTLEDVVDTLIWGPNVGIDIVKKEANKN